jgi:RNase P subunit RPR2
MKETIDALQMLVLLMVLLLSLVMLLGFVYTFRLLLAALKNLGQTAADKPLVTSQTHTATATVEKAVEIEKAIDTPKAVALPRYLCHRCNGRLPETPVSSRIDGDATFLKYKCGRCGKETEIDPEKATPAPPR